MSLVNLFDYAGGDTVNVSWWNDIHSALNGDFVGRVGGVATAGQSLGRATLPWGNAYISRLIVDGDLIDFSSLAIEGYAIISSRVRSTSNQPQYLQPNGATNSATILGLTTNLTILIDGEAVDVTTDVALTGLSLAPAVTNTCTIDDVSLVGQESSKYTGEFETPLTVDNMGANVTALIGTWQAFINQTSSEVFYCHINSATELLHIQRGIGYDNAFAYAGRSVCNDGETLQLLKTSYIFVENNGSTTEEITTKPTYSPDEPAAPSAGDYWFNISSPEWKRYSGATWETVNRHYVGLVICDTANCIVASNEQYTRTFVETNNVEVERESATVVKISNPLYYCGVYGDDVNYHSDIYGWDIATDLDSGVAENPSTTYYLYLKDTAEPVISDVRPRDNRFLRGLYHPYNPWRCVASIYNDGGGDFSTTASDIQIFGSKEEVVDRHLKSLSLDDVLNVGGALSVSGVSTLAALSCTTLNASGLSTLAAVGCNALVCTALTNSALTSGRIPFISTGGLFIDDASLTYSKTASLARIIQAQGGVGYSSHQFSNATVTMNIGVENSAGGGLLTGSTAYYGIITAISNHGLQFGTNDLVRLTLNNNGNLGFGTTDIEAWHTNYSAIEFGRSAIIGGKAGDFIGVFSNSYLHTSGEYRYKTTAATTMYHQASGAHNFRVAPSGTINTAITWISAWVINNGGNFVGQQITNSIATLSDSNRLILTGGLTVTGSSNSGAYIRLEGNNFGGTDVGGSMTIVAGNEVGADINIGAGGATIMTVAYDGSITHNNYTALGSGNVKIKVKKLTGTLDIVGTVVNIAHGLTSSKILYVTGRWEQSAGVYSPFGAISGGASEEYAELSSWSATNVRVYARNALAANKAVVLTVIYEE